MDFQFSEEQQAFRQSVRDALEKEFPPDRVRELADTDAGISAEAWSMFASLGWTGVLVPEEHGGLGLGLVDAIILMEEMGRLPLPGPFWSSAGLATLAAGRFGAQELLAGLADGTSRGTVALDEGGSRDPLDAIRTTAVAAGGTWTLDGVKLAVPDGHTADWAIVVAHTPDGLGAFLVEEPHASLQATIDPSRKLARLELRGTPARQLDADEGAIRRLLDDAAVLLAAESVGAAERALELAVEYSHQRVQFGRPIGAFQAMKHLAAEMLQRVELARVGVHYAAWTSDEDADDRERAAAIAASWSAEAAIGVTGDSIQIHGGVGFTWDAHVQLHFKRAKVNDVLLGQQGWHRQRVADLVLGPVGATA